MRRARGRARTSRVWLAVRTDRADALADAGQDPAHRDQAEHDGEGDRQRQQDAPAADRPWRRTSGRARRRRRRCRRPGACGPGRPAAGRTRRSPPTPITSSPANSGSVSRTLRGQHAGRGSTLAPIRYCVARSRNLVSVAVADVDEAAVGERLDVAGADLVDAEPGGLEVGVRPSCRRTPRRAGRAACSPRGSGSANCGRPSPVAAAPSAGTGSVGSGAPRLRATASDGEHSDGQCRQRAAGSRHGGKGIRRPRRTWSGQAGERPMR